MENSFERYRTSNKNFCKAQTIYRFCQTENSKSCDKLEESSKKPAGTDYSSDDQRVVGSCMIPDSNPEGESLF